MRTKTAWPSDLTGPGRGVVGVRDGMILGVGLPCVP